MEKRDEVSIRKTGIEDIAGIAKVHVDTWKCTYKGIVSDEFLNDLSYEKTEKRMEVLYNETYKNCLTVLDANGRIIGFAVYGPQRESNTEYKGEVISKGTVPMVNTTFEVKQQ